MVIPKINRNILKEVAAENGVSFNEAVEAIYSQFNFLSVSIKEADLNDLSTFKGIRLMRFGLFFPHMRKLLVTRYKRGIDEEYNGEFFST